MTGGFLAPPGPPAPAARPPRPLTVEQVAARLATDPRTVRRLIARGRFPGAFRLDVSLKSPWRVPVAALDAHIARTATLELSKVPELSEVSGNPSRREPGRVRRAVR